MQQPCQFEKRRKINAMTVVDTGDVAASACLSANAARQKLPPIGAIVTSR
jgi:hypothetical protein